MFHLRWQYFQHLVPFASLALLAFAEQSFHHSLSDQQKADFLWFPSHPWPVPI